MSSCSDYRDCDSYVETLKKAAREQRAHRRADAALAACPVESTVVLPGSLELRAAQGNDVNLGSTGEGLAISIPPAGAQPDTMRIARGDRARPSRLSFHVALTVAMLGVTIGLLSGQAMPTGVRAAATAASHARSASETPVPRPSAEPRTVTADKTPLEGTVRGKAVRPVIRYVATPSGAAHRPGASGTSSGPSAGELNESLQALAEAQAARPF